MFMHQKLVELERKNMWLGNDNKDLRKRVDELGKKLEERNAHQARMHTLDIVSTKLTIRKEMQEALIKSDLLRVEAVAKLNTYIEMDTKDERKHIQEMLKDAIKGLSNQPSINIAK